MRMCAAARQFAEQSPSGTVEQADIYAIATAGLEDGSGPGIPSSAVDKVLQYVSKCALGRGAD